MLDPISKFIMEHMIEGTAELLMPTMILMFLAGVFFRGVILYTVRSEMHFAVEFEKRVKKHFSDPQRKRVDSFFMLTKQLLEQTYREVFEFRARFKRRNLDHVAVLSDRVFLIQDGVAYLVRDTLRQIRYLKRDGYPPRMLEISKSSYENNPVFNKIMGAFPAHMINELINIMPSLFIIGGIFGTFLGISKGLPELGNMDLSNLEESKKIMDLFLIKISQSMVKSIVGIALSVIMSVINTLLSVEGMYFGVVNRYTSALEILWNETTSNEIVGSFEEPGTPADQRSGTTTTAAAPGAEGDPTDKAA